MPLEKILMGAIGQTEGKNRSSTFVLTAFVPLADLTFSVNTNTTSTLNQLRVLNAGST